MEQLMQWPLAVNDGETQQQQTILLFDFDDGDDEVAVAVVIRDVSC
jgi:hypothetical protein